MLAPQGLRTVAYWLRERPQLGRLALALLPDALWWRTIPGLGTFRIRLRTHRSWWLREPLESEAFPFAALRALLQPGQVAYDVGANIGLYCRYLTGDLGARHIVAFEPMRSNREVLRLNLALGCIQDRVTVQPLALADEEGELEFEVDDMQSTSGTLAKVTGGLAAEGRRSLGLPPKRTRVTVRTLDGVVDELAELGSPEVIKIDVEGAEAMVLAGARNTLKRKGAKFVVELHGATCAKEVAARFAENRYSMLGKVDRRLAPTGVAVVDADLLAQVRGPYDLHFLVAVPPQVSLPSELLRVRAPA